MGDWVQLHTAIKDLASLEGDVHALWYAFANAESADDIQQGIEDAESCGGSLKTVPKMIDNVSNIKTDNWDSRIIEIAQRISWKSCQKRKMVGTIQTPCFIKRGTKCFYCKSNVKQYRPYPFTDPCILEAMRLLFGKSHGYKINP
jgi:hypothetical protein